MKYALFFITSFVLFSGFTCSKSIPGEPQTRDSDDLVKYRDQSNGVTCYRTYRYDGFSCVKDK